MRQQLGRDGAGRPRTPIRQKIAAGTYNPTRDRAALEAELELFRLYPPTIPEAPPHFTEGSPELSAYRWWGRVLATFECMTEWDAPVLAELAAEYTLLVEVNAKLRAAKRSALGRLLRERKKKWREVNKLLHHSFGTHLEVTYEGGLDQRGPRPVGLKILALKAAEGKLRFRAPHRPSASA